MDGGYTEVERRLFGEVRRPARGPSTQRALRSSQTTARRQRCPRAEPGPRLNEAQLLRPVPPASLDIAHVHHYVDSLSLRHGTLLGSGFPKLGPLSQNSYTTGFKKNKSGSKKSFGDRSPHRSPTAPATDPPPVGPSREPGGLSHEQSPISWHCNSRPYTGTALTHARGGSVGFPAGPPFLHCNELFLISKHFGPRPSSRPSARAARRRSGDAPLAGRPTPGGQTRPPGAPAHPAGTRTSTSRTSPSR